MVDCKLCKGQFEKSPDTLVMCNNHGGPVHMGCCVNCAWDRKPCSHAEAIYAKLT